MVWVLINSIGRRIKLLNGSLTPAFQYPIQAYRYAEERQMQYYDIKRVNEE